MPDSQIAPGDVVLVAFPRHNPRGHEQEGVRPAIVVGIPQFPMRFPQVWVIPLTSQSGPWQEANPDLYPVLPAGTAALPKDSVALADNLRAIDRSRVGAFIGSLPPDTLLSIRTALVRTIPPATVRPGGLHRAHRDSVSSMGDNPPDRPKDRPARIARKAAQSRPWGNSSCPRAVT